MSKRPLPPSARVARSYVRLAVKAMKHEQAVLHELFVSNAIPSAGLGFMLGGVERRLRETVAHLEHMALGRAKKTRLKPIAKLGEAARARA